MTTTEPYTIQIVDNSAPTEGELRENEALIQVRRANATALLDAEYYAWHMLSC